MGVTKDKTGERFITNEGCEIIIIQYNKSIDLWIEFQDKYKARIHTSYNACKDGEVKNPYFPNVYGVGCLGLMPDNTKPITRKNGKTTKEYYLWKGMIGRCYSEKFSERNPSYKDATVCDRWLVFANFLEDLPLIEGYELWKNNSGYALDKDLKGNGSKTYSLENCCFITIGNNSKERYDRLKETEDKRLKELNNDKSIRVYGVNTVTGEKTKVFNSIREASREMSLNDSSIGKCIKGTQKTTGGYRWYKIDDEN